MDDEQLEALERIANLRQQGLLTDAEVEAEKRRILSPSSGTENLAPTGGYWSPKTDVDASPKTDVDAPKPRSTSPIRLMLAVLVGVIAATALYLVVVRDGSEVTGGGELSEAGSALRAAFTAQTFRNLTSNSNVIASGTPADFKFTAITNAYALSFQDGIVGEKKNLSETNDSFLYCALHSTNSDSCATYYEVSDIVESADHQIIDFSWSIGSSENDVVGIALGLTDGMQWSDLEETGTEFSVLSAVDRWGQTCFAIEFETLWDDTTFYGMYVMAWTADGLLVDKSFQPPWSERINRGGPQLRQLCFDYPIHELISLEFGDNAMTYTDLSGSSRYSFAHSMPVDFGKLYIPGK